MPDIIIHILADVLLFFAFYLVEKNFLKKEFNHWFVSFQLLASNIMDIDHLLANPIYDPNRCSINFHPLHSWYSYPFYVAGLFLRKYKYFFAGIILHLLLDYIDCFI